MQLSPCPAQKIIRRSFEDIQNTFLNERNSAVLKISRTFHYSGTYRIVCDVNESRQILEITVDDLAHKPVVPDVSGEAEHFVEKNGKCP